MLLVCNLGIGFDSTLEFQHAWLVMDTIKKQAKATENQYICQIMLKDIGIQCLILGTSWMYSMNVVYDDL